MNPHRDELQRLRAHTVAHWNAVYGEDTPSAISTPGVGNDTLDAALDWLCGDAASVLDFGCGNGVVLVKCGLRGVQTLTGIDMSGGAIQVGRALFVHNHLPPESLICGGHEALEALGDDTQDAVILWNIIDNMPPEDAKNALNQIKRVLRPGGRILLKLNPYLTPEKRKEWNVRTIDGDLLDDGLLLWNQTDAQWDDLLSPLFSIERFEIVTYPEYDMTNRLFWLVNQ